MHLFTSLTNRCHIVSAIITRHQSLLLKGKERQLIAKKVNQNFPVNLSSPLTPQHGAYHLPATRSLTALVIVPSYPCLSSLFSSLMYAFQMDSNLSGDSRIIFDKYFF